MPLEFLRCQCKVGLQSGLVPQLGHRILLWLHNLISVGALHNDFCLNDI